jgi:hypothetical protein
MAIRDDFTAGEVLAAADLNDTFAEKIPYAYGTATPTTTVDGYVWFDENETPPAPKFWDGAAFQAVSAPGGLVHITTESFSAVSSISLNNAFTSTYANYKIVLFLSAVSAGQEIFMKFRNGGSDRSDANYLSSNRGTDDGGTLASRAFAGGSSGMALGYTSGSHTFSSDVDVFGPLAFQRGVILGMSFGQLSIGGGFASWRVGGKFNNASTSDGFSIISSTGNITGTLRVYGYLNS